MITAGFVPIGESGRMLHPYDMGDWDTNFMNLRSNDYIRGLEGRAMCDVAREYQGPEFWEKTGKNHCIEKVLLASPPRK